MNALPAERVHPAAGERHAAYKATPEKLRNMPHMEAERHFERYFHDLTPDDRAVLSQLITRPSLQRMADAIRHAGEQVRGH